MDITITLTEDQAAAWEDMLNTDDITIALPQHAIKVAETHIDGRFSEELNKKSRKELKVFLGDKFKIKKEK